MSRNLSLPLAGVLAAAILMLPGAAAGKTSTSGSGRQNVYVRVEGAGATLLPQTLIQIAGQETLRGHTCPGPNAALALTEAAHSQWTGTWFKSFGDFEVTNILGETPATSSDYWTLWINGRSSSTGACSSTLGSGDHELWFDCQGSSTGACSNDPLAISAPSSARRGRPITVKVTQLSASGHGTPVAGAAVTGGGVAATTGANGKARFIPTGSGIISLRAAKTGATPSDTVFACIYPTRRAQCMSIRRDGPRTRVFGIRNGEIFHGRGPARLAGSAGPDPLGLTDVRLTLLRQTASGACSYYDAGSTRWHPRGCNDAPTASPFSVGPNTLWSYALPHALGPGGYRFVAVAEDSAARQTRVVVGSSAVEFVVTS